MSYLLDTNVISELVAPQPSPAVIQWVESVEEERVYLSVITIGELKRGIEKLRPSRRRRVLERWLVEDLLVRFGERVLPLDVPVLLTWGSLVARAEAKGRPMAAIDSLVAATAAHHGLTLVTRNVQDFQAAEVPLLNPWEFNA